MDQQATVYTSPTDNGGSHSKKIFLGVLFLILIIVGIIISVYLVQTRQIFKSRASADAVGALSSTGEQLPKENDIPVTTTPQIQLKLNPPAAP